MSSSLSFVPRKLAKSLNTTKPQTSSGNAYRSSQVLSSSTSPATPKPSDVTLDSPSKYDDKDYANLVALSLSDYALWIDADLRQSLGVGAQPDPKSGARYISLAQILKRSAALAGLLEDRPGKMSHTTQSSVQTSLVKAIRAHASHLFDVRLLLHPDQTVPRFGKQKEIGGGYEIGRKRMGLVMRGKSDWDACTLYVENLPPGYCSYAEIVRFLNDLLHSVPPIPSSSTFPVDPLTRIQAISFPPHHSDKPDARPSCKGFALVTLAHATDCKYLANSWPWFPSTQPTTEPPTQKTDDGEEPDSVLEAARTARRHNFRVLTKERWLQLKAEYLTYRQQLVEQINAYQDSRKGVEVSTQPVMLEASQVTDTAPPCPQSENLPPTEDTSITITPSSPYPLNCLAFVKHVHPETTKTTLRQLLSQAFRQGAVQPQENVVEGLDYVDFNKGMDTCYLRLATPMHTTALVDYFSRSGRRIVQVSGMDETGIDASSEAASIPRGLEPIVVDCVTGRPEEIYWEKVPMKVRKGAVERAMQPVAAGDDRSRGAGQKRSWDGGSDQENPNTRKKKRRKL